VQGTLADIEKHGGLPDRPLPEKSAGIRAHGTAIVRRRRAMGRDPRRAREQFKKCGRAFRSDGLSVITGISGREIDVNGRGPPAGGEGRARRDALPRVQGHAEACPSDSGAEAFETVYEVDQSPIGKTSRSTPATYSRFRQIRKLYGTVRLAHARYSPSRFRLIRRRPLRNVRRAGRDQAEMSFSEQLMCRVRIAAAGVTTRNARSSLNERASGDVM